MIACTPSKEVSSPPHNDAPFQQHSQALLLILFLCFCTGALLSKAVVLPSGGYGTFLCREARRRFEGAERGRGEGAIRAVG
jgi:hypothetical protein